MKKIKLLLVSGVIVYVLYVLTCQQKEINLYKSEEKNYNQLIASEQAKNDDLNILKSNIDSTEYIEEVAREKLNMYLPNERVYIDISK